MKIHRFLFVFILQILGVLIIASLAYNNLKSEQLKAASHVKDEVNSMIYLLTSYYNSELTNVIDNSTCNKKIESINDFLLLTPPLKSINVSDSKHIFCSSYFQKRVVNTPSWFFTKDTIRLIFSNYIPTNSRINLGDRKVFLLQMKTNDEISSVFSIYASVIYKLLHFYGSNYYNLFFQVSNGAFSPQGPVLKSSGDFLTGNQELFSVYYTSSFEQFFSYLYKNYIWIVLFWIITSIVSSHFLYNVIFILGYRSRLIKKGLKRSEFYPYLQPVFDRTGKMVGAEVLVRWINKDGVVISPAEFIDEAEESGLIKDIMSQLVDKCILSLKRVNIPDDKQFVLALNTCPVQFEDDQLFDDINRLASSFERHNIKVIIEITERQEFASNEHYRTSIEKLKKNNVQISLDDFGTGNCSLKYLHQVSVDILKIDKSYINLIGAGNNNAVLENIIDLARRLNLRLVAEGVETKTQYDYLMNKEIECFQGFLLGKPVPLDQFVEQYLS